MISFQALSPHSSVRFGNQLLTRTQLTAEIKKELGTQGFDPDYTYNFTLRVWDEGAGKEIQVALDYGKKLQLDTVLKNILPKVTQALLSVKDMTQVQNQPYEFKYHAVPVKIAIQHDPRF